MLCIKYLQLTWYPNPGANYSHFSYMSMKS